MGNTSRSRMLLEYDRLHEIKCVLGMGILMKHHRSGQIIYMEQVIKNDLNESVIFEAQLRNYQLISHPTVLKILGYEKLDENSMSCSVSSKFNIAYEFSELTLQKQLELLSQRNSLMGENRIVRLIEDVVDLLCDLQEREYPIQEITPEHLIVFDEQFKLAVPFKRNLPTPVYFSKRQLDVLKHKMQSIRAKKTMRVTFKDLVFQLGLISVQCMTFLPIVKLYDYDRSTFDVDKLNEYLNETNSYSQQCIDIVLLMLKIDENSQLSPVELRREIKLILNPLHGKQLNLYPVQLSEPYVTDTYSSRQLNIIHSKKQSQLQQLSDRSDNQDSIYQSIHKLEPISQENIRRSQQSMTSNKSNNQRRFIHPDQLDAVKPLQHIDLRHSKDYDEQLQQGQQLQKQLQQNEQLRQSLHLQQIDQGLNLKVYNQWREQAQKDYNDLKDYISVPSTSEVRQQSNKNYDYDQKPQHQESIHQLVPLKSPRIHGQDNLEKNFSFNKSKMQDDTKNIVSMQSDRFENYSQLRFSRDTFMPQENRHMTQISFARQTELKSSRMSIDFAGNKYKPSNQVKEKVSGSYYPEGIYSGEVVGDIREGYGTLRFNDGGTYEGEWIADKMQGRGTLYNSDQVAVYIGEWFDSLLHGQGTLYNDAVEQKLDLDYRNLDSLDKCWVKYQGYFLNDSQSGQGTLFFSNGDRFEGTFHEDKAHGPGEYIYANGEIIRGRWRMNQLVEY